MYVFLNTLKFPILTLSALFSDLIDFPKKILLCKRSESEYVYYVAYTAHSIRLQNMCRIISIHSESHMMMSLLGLYPHLHTLLLFHPVVAKRSFTHHHCLAFSTVVLVFFSFFFALNRARGKAQAAFTWLLQWKSVLCCCYFYFSWILMTWFLSIQKWNQSWSDHHH